MRPIIIILTVLITGCTSDRIYIDDVNHLLADQLESNLIEIDRIKKDISQYKIDHVEFNISLMKHLDQLHHDILLFLDSVDIDEKSKAYNRVMRFINRNFTDLEYHPIPKTKKEEFTPRALLKMRIAMLEAYYIRQQRLRYDFEIDGMRFNYTTVHIRPSKTILKIGEKLTGELVLGAESNFDDSRKVIRKMILNGQEVEASKDGWHFEIVPQVDGRGLQLYELRCEAIIHGKVLSGRNLVYVSLIRY